MSLSNFGHLMFDKKVQTLILEGKKLFQMVLNKWNVHTQQNEIRSVFINMHKTNSKWIKDFNLKQDVLKLLEGNTDSTLYYIDIKKDFLNRTPFVQELKSTFDK